jgi:hypothetical protein
LGQHPLRRVYPFGSQANADFYKPSSLGFAPQPCDWFAFIEDDDAAGSSLLGFSRSTTSVKKPNGSGEEKIRRWRPQRSPFVVR